MQFYFVFKFFVPKAYFLKVLDGTVFLWILWVFLLRLPNLKNDISYIKYTFSHRFVKVCKGLNIYYSNFRIIIKKKVISMSIWIIFNNLVWTCKKCKNYRKWAIWLCIYPSIHDGHGLMMMYDIYMHLNSFHIIICDGSKYIVTHFDINTKINKLYVCIKFIHV